MLHLEASGATDGSVNKTWEEIPDQPPDSCKEGKNHIVFSCCSSKS